VFEYEVSTDDAWTARSDRGGSPRQREEAWTPEHLVLAGLAQCTLKSLRYHAKRIGVTATATAKAHGTVTRRDEDGRFAFVAIDVVVDVSLEPDQTPEALRDLLERGERDCFVGASLTPQPTYSWRVEGEEL
jgi:uncharacterized OsmC-like protein